jgi:pimeloyl-ACP methyl ester carboxylesterase
MRAGRGLLEFQLVLATASSPMHTKWGFGRYHSTVATSPLASTSFATMAKPTIVLVPGAWHSASCYSHLTPLLDTEGYDTLPLTLPSVGADPAVQSLDPDVQHIRSHIQPLVDDGKNVVLVMHSYGGSPGGSAAKGFAKKDREAEGLEGGIVALVYVCAWMIEEGTNVRGNGGSRGGKLGPSSLKIEVSERPGYANAVG